MAVRLVQIATQRPFTLGDPGLRGPAPLGLLDQPGHPHYVFFECSEQNARLLHIG